MWAVVQNFITFLHLCNNKVGKKSDISLSRFCAAAMFHSYCYHRFSDYRSLLLITNNVMILYVARTPYLSPNRTKLIGVEYFCKKYTPELIDHTSFLLLYNLRRYLRLKWIHIKKSWFLGFLLLTKKGMKTEIYQHTGILSYWDITVVNIKIKESYQTFVLFQKMVVP